MKERDNFFHAPIILQESSFYRCQPKPHKQSLYKLKINSTVDIFKYFLGNHKLVISGGIKGEGDGAFALPQSEALPPHLSPPPRQKKKWPKSVIFGKFLNFCPLRIAFFPLDAPTKKLPGAVIPCYATVWAKVKSIASIYCCTLSSYQLSRKLNSTLI